MGKYQSKFYTKSEAVNSSSIGGVVTIIIIVIMISYASYVMQQIISK